MRDQVSSMDICICVFIQMRGQILSALPVSAQAASMDASFCAFTQRRQHGYLHMCIPSKDRSILSALPVCAQAASIDVRFYPFTRMRGLTTCMDTCVCVFIQMRGLITCMILAFVYLFK